MTILVTGATGRIGSLVLNHLHSKGLYFRSAVRKPTSAHDVAFDWIDSSGWTDATKGIRDLFLMTPENMGNLSENVEAFLETAKGQGVQRIILLSAHGVDRDDHGTGMAHIEAVVRWNFEDHCIFRPNTFMQNFSAGPFLQSILQQSALIAPLGDAKISFIDLEDIARCVASALANPQLKGTFDLTGGKAVSFEEAASEISTVTSSPVEYRHVSDEDMGNILGKSGLPPHLLNMVLGFYTSLRDPSHASVASSVEEITGQAPQSFSAFVSRNRDAWQSHV